MAKKGGSLKRIFLVLVLLALLFVVFIIMGGGRFLKSTGIWLGGVGKQAEEVKQSIEQKATTIEKTVEKLKDGDKTGAGK